ncbi:related to vacuolar membrane protein HMT1 [Cephalotrichum gorgonifer]|uniref:Related to vacuolar membrane protein HMT1 n=1 Tax=Cephalotrichum gorgonifer TaxID=2041049 RepID=A0AAE8N214_9PEZI|nr:related to vacuolar membrane protein HMT1 [Cephalotrichum gorgonifer]
MDDLPIGLLEGLHYLYPSFSFTYFTIATAVSVCTLETLKAAIEPKNKRVPRTTILYLMLFVAGIYLAELVTVVIRSLVANSWLGREDVIVGWLSCFMVYGVQSASLAKTDHPVWYPLYGSWILGIACEGMLATLYLRRSDNFFSGLPVIVHFCLSTLRACVLLLLVIAYFVRQDRADGTPSSDEERQSLLNGNGSAQPTESLGNGSDVTGQTKNPGYGSTEATREAAKKRSNELPYERREREGRERREKRLREDGNWFTYVRKFFILWPHIWPVGNYWLQFRAVLVVICLLIQNALNLLIPRQMGIIMDILSGAREGNAWIQVMIFAVLKFLASDSGIDYVRQRIYFPLENYSRDALVTAAYRHILSLSADFHDSQSTSDTILAVRGGETISSMVDKLAFSAFPRVVDLVIAIIYLSMKFGPYEGFITISTAICYLHVATVLVGGMKEARRDQVTSYYDKNGLLQAGIEGWHTVTAFNQIGYEDNRHTNAVRVYTAKAKVLYFKWFSIHALQSCVLLSGLLAGSFLAVARIQNGMATPGDFAMLLAYWSQLTGPLMFFSSLGKQVSNDLIHAERLLDMMYKHPTVMNKKGARPLNFTRGAVEFEDVFFSYDKRKDIIHNLTFTVPGGQSVAFVGATGAGKSTIIKLLARLYDVKSGSIRVDGQDIRDVDLSSLRDRIGIVPQAPVLFNDTILNNIRYARITASDEEVFDACRAAWIHDKILSFSDGYETRVGERGVKLSGGELQRVAIARAMLKSPDLVILDEATSSVDTDTEHKIQKSLAQLCDGRTTFVVAHRLSTIMNADRIIVIGDGTILESGDHETLIRSGGKYANLWSKQVFLKPKKKGKGVSESTTPSTLINDLEPETAEAELVKIHTDSSSTEDGQDGVGEDGQAVESKKASKRRIEIESRRSRVYASIPAKARDFDVTSWPWKGGRR